MRIHPHNQPQWVTTQGQPKEFQEQNLATQQEPIELRQRVQFPQKSVYSVVSQFAICLFDFDNGPLHQLGPRTIREQLL